MSLQAYLDESDDGVFFVLAGYVSKAEAWAQFTREWGQLLPHAVLSNGNTYQFKMSAMALLPERLARVPMFYRPIEKHAAFAISIHFKIDDLKSALRRITVPNTKINWKNWHNPYCLGFRALTDALNRRRGDLGQILGPTEVIDFVFDDRSEKAKIVWAWDRVRQTIPPEQAALYGKAPRFENDEEFLPLQAADFWAWWLRKWARVEIRLSHMMATSHGVSIPRNRRR